MLSPQNLQEVTPNILKQILCLFNTKFSTFINVHKVAMKKVDPNVLFVDIILK